MNKFVKHSAHVDSYDENHQPLFSVLIANYNNGKYLMEAIESVRQQTYTNWEIVLVDDGSTDNSIDLYKELQEDQRIYIFYNNENKGCGYTKRRCVELANGDYCGFLDPDDALLPCALEVSVEALLSNHQVVLTMSRFYFCDEHLNITKESRFLNLKEGESYFERNDYRPEAFASFVKRAYLITQGIDESLQAAVDQDLYFKLDEVGIIVSLRDITYKYRIHDGSLSHGTNSDWAWYWNIIVWHNTCLRRHLSERDFSFVSFNKYLSTLKSDTRYETEKVIKTSWSYRIGSFFVNPIKKMFRK